MNWFVDWNSLPLQTGILLHTYMPLRGSSNRFIFQKPYELRSECQQYINLVILSWFFLAIPWHLLTGPKLTQKITPHKYRHFLSVLPAKYTLFYSIPKKYTHTKLPRNKSTKSISVTSAFATSACSAPNSLCLGSNLGRMQHEQRKWYRP